MRTREGVGRRRRRLRLATAVVLIVAVGAAIVAGLSAASTNATSVTNYVAYVGGKPGRANLKLSPIYVGYVNQEGGPIVVGKTADNGVDAATANTNSSSVG